MITAIKATDSLGHRWFHGSTVCIPEPKLLPSHRRLDFGPGFYLTSNEAQATNWAIIKKRRLNEKLAIVSFYEAKFVLEENHLKIFNFTGPDETWLDYVMLNRTEIHSPNDDFDIISGPVANDNLYETLALYERKLLTRQETIVRLKTQKLADQICVRTQKALDRLIFIDCKEVNYGR